MSIQIANPYLNHTMILRGDMFFGRKTQLRRLYSALVTYQSVSILGPRRIGKSSLLWCSSLQEVQERFPFDLRHHIFIFLDLHDFLDKTSDDFFRKVCKEITLQYERVANLSLQKDDDTNARDAFSNILDQLADLNTFPVLLLDSFDKVAQNKHFSPAFFGFLRSQASRGRVSYVTASIAPIREVCHRSVADSPFFNIFFENRLESLTDEEAYELITVPAQQAGMPFTETETRWIQKLAGHHPFFLQCVCDVLFDEKTQCDNYDFSKNDESNLRRLQELAFDDLLSQFKGMWEELSESQQTTMRHEAHQQEHERRKMPYLSESFLFRQFVQNTSQIGFFNMTVDELEKTLSIMNEPSELENLGNTPMHLMHIVTQRLNKNASVSANERGMAIREVLRDAFERMKIAGVRSDTASEWRYYNILYYRHFRYHLTNEQLAARLGLGSVRQYYRERTRAIEALLNKLLEMERLATTQE